MKQYLEEKKVRVGHKQYSQPLLRGFALPTVLMVSLALMIISVAVLQTSISLRLALNDQYYNQLAKEAAEAGTIYANACLQANDHDQTWGPSLGRPNLGLTTDCQGAPVDNEQTSLVSDERIRSTFSVGNLLRRAGGSLLLSSVGTVEVLGPGGNVIKTYTHTFNRAVSWQAYQTSKLASGAYRSCAIVSKEVYCWGTQNSFGQLGNGLSGGESAVSTVPTRVVQEPGVLANKEVTDLAAGEYHNCVIALGEVYCWGRNVNGELGINSAETVVRKPVKVEGLLTGKIVTAISAGKNHTCAIAESKVYCWGSHSNGQLGVGTITVPGANRAPALVAAPLSGLNATALGGDSNQNHTCAVANGRAYCWGANDTGQLGNDTVGLDANTPQAVDTTDHLAGKTVFEVDAGGNNTGGSTNIDQGHSCAVTTELKAYCWGFNNFGQLGINSPSIQELTPQPVDQTGELAGKSITSVLLGQHHGCALANASVYCWGYNGGGQLGLGPAVSNSRYPRQVLPNGNFTNASVTALGGGGNRGCGIENAINYCWGINYEGQIGDGTSGPGNSPRYLPVESVFLRSRAPSFLF